MKHRHQVALRCAAAIAAVIVSYACGGGESSTAPKGPVPPITVVAGESATDTALTQFLQALVVEVRDPNGTPRRGTVVRFVALPPTDTARRYEAAVSVANLLTNSFGALSVDQTDSSGRAKALVRLGTVAGTAMIQIDVPELGVDDTARYTVLPGAGTQLTMRVRDTTVYPGAQYTIGAAVKDRWGNARPNDVVTYTSLTANVSVDPSGKLSATAEGRAKIVVAGGTKIDTARASVMPQGTLLYVSQGYPRAVSSLNLDRSGARTIYPITDMSVGPEWAPDGNSFVAYLGDPNYNARIVKVSMDGSVSQIVSVGATSKLNGLAWPRFAPDGSIYFCGVTSGVGYQIWHVNADGTGLAVVPNTLGTDFQHPVVSGDGKSLYFETGSPGKIYKLDLASGATTYLGISGTFPSPSPDGSKLAYISNYRVMLADISGANSSAVTPANSYVMDYTPPSWSSDSKWLLLPYSYSGAPSLMRLSDQTTMPLPSVTGGYFQVVLR